MILLHPWFLLVCLPCCHWPVLAEGQVGARLHLPGSWQRLVTPEMRGLVARSRDRFARHDRRPGRSALAGAGTHPFRAGPHRMAKVGLQIWPDDGCWFWTLTDRIAATPCGVPPWILPRHFPTSRRAGGRWRCLRHRALHHRPATYSPVSVSAEPRRDAGSGYEPQRAIAHAEAMLVRAEMIAGQGVLITGSETVPSGQLARDRWLRAVMFVRQGSSAPAPISALADNADARLVAAGEHSEIDADLSEAISSLVDGHNRSFRVRHLCGPGSLAWPAFSGGSSSGGPHDPCALISLVLLGRICWGRLADPGA